MRGQREFVLDMGFTHAEFMNLLPAALGVDRFQVAGGTIVVEDGRGTVRITLGSESVRRIASLALPSLPVTLCFESYEPAEIERFMGRFRSHYQRGGG